MAVPLVGIYMPVYEGILLYLSRRTSTGDIPAWGPLVAGSTSRMLSVVCVAPLELLRTQSQAFARGRPRKVRRPGVRPPSAWSWHRITRMWTGTSATLARDVPYSALYWSGVELLRSALSPSSGEASDAQVCLLCLVPRYLQASGPVAVL